MTQEAHKMNPEVKAKWVAALRSGEYTQTGEALKDANGFCCLGVLCDLYAKTSGKSAWTVWELGQIDDDGHSTDDTLPGDAVCSWANLDVEVKVQIGGKIAALYEHNDGSKEKALVGRTFAEIADAIEAQL